MGGHAQSLDSPEFLVKFDSLEFFFLFFEESVAIDCETEKQPIQPFGSVAESLAIIEPNIATFVQRIAAVALLLLFENDAEFI